MLSQNARGRTSARYEDLFFQKEKISFSSLSKKRFKILVFCQQGNGKPKPQRDNGSRSNISIGLNCVVVDGMYLLVEVKNENRKTS